MIRVHRQSPSPQRQQGNSRTLAGSADIRRGYVLIAVLIVITVLSLAAYRYSDLMTAEYRATHRILLAVEAKALADSGIHYAAALLADKTAFSGAPINGNPFNNEGVFRGQVMIDGRPGRFSVVYVDYAADGGSGMIPWKYGVSDEAGRININALVELDRSGQVVLNVLRKLPGMTDDIANSIIDWIDSDDDTRSGGAEATYYLSRSPAYRCKNGPLDSIEELLLIKGISAEMLFGNDLNRNGRRDPEEETGGEFSYGWAPYLTVYSREANVDNDGNPRINVNGRNLKTVYDQLKTAVSPELAAYLVAYRLYDLPSSSSKSSTPVKVGSITDLVTKVEKDLSASQPPRARRSVASLLQLIGTSVQVAGQSKGKEQEPASVFAFPVADASAARELLPTVLDKLTTVSDKDLPARINVNTASEAVLRTLPGLETSDIEAIMGRRESLTDPIYQTPAWLYTEANIPVAKLQAIERYVTARSQVYRIQSVGYYERGGPSARVEAIVDTNNGKPRFLYYRDLTELGRAIDPRIN